MNSGMEEVIASFEEQEAEIQSLVTMREAFTPTGKKIREATEKDVTLKQVSRRLDERWRKSDFKDPLLRPYAQQADALCCTKEVILCGDRVVIIPSSPRPSVLKKLHTAHPVIARMKAPARAHFYWPGMSSDLEALVESCNHCAQNAAAPVKVPLSLWPDPGKPRVHIHLHFAEPQQGNSFLVVVDAFSKPPS